MAAGVCSECGASLAGMNASARTCSSACRSRRRRRKAAANRRAGETRSLAPQTPEHQLINQINQNEVKDIIHDVAREELRPIVREQLTEETLHAVADMIRLTPRVVEVLGEDLNSENKQLRHKSAALIAKYTLGHPAILQPEQSSGQGLTVNLGLPRLDDPPAPSEASDVVEAEAVEEAELHTSELQQCTECQETYPKDRFVGESLRCQSCHDKLQEAVRERFGDYNSID